MNIFPACAVSALPACTVSALRRLTLNGVIAGCSLCLAGCGYMVGNAYAPNVRTIEIPIFANDTYRRGIEYQLTEAIQRKVQQRTPYRLARQGQGDTKLTGRIVDVTKDVLGENQFDDPRQLQSTFMVRVSWEDRRNGQLLNEQQLPLPGESFALTATSEFAPEVGQSQATATQEAVDQLATKIVNMLESPW